MVVPALRHVNISYLQQVLERKKKCYSQDEAPERKLPNYVEFSVKMILDNGYVSKECIRDYFPDNPQSVDKSFFWRVWRKHDDDKGRVEKYI